MSIDWINQADPDEAADWFDRTCHAQRWVQAMVAARPYVGADALLKQAEQSWQDLQKPDFLQAFAAHPKIGDINSLQTKYAATRTTARDEQRGVDQASRETLQALQQANAAYEARFGYIFIIFASGKSADEMLSLLHQRLTHDPETEINIAAAEQYKITRLRLINQLQALV